MDEYNPKKWLSQSEWDSMSKKCDREWALQRDRFPVQVVESKPEPASVVIQKPEHVYGEHSIDGVALVGDEMEMID